MAVRFTLMHNNGCFLEVNSVCKQSHNNAIYDNNKGLAHHLLDWNA